MEMASLGLRLYSKIPVTHLLTGCLLVYIQQERHASGCCQVHLPYVTVAAFLHAHAQLKAQDLLLPSAQGLLRHDDLCFHHTSPQ